MKIYTKTGDEGETSLLGGKRVSKANLRIDAYGTVDELNSFIGLVRDSLSDEQSLTVLKVIQDRLFTIGATLASDPEKQNIKKPDVLLSDIELLEEQIDKMNDELPELKSFILPGGSQLVSYCHITRCVCRRAERIVVELSDSNEVDTLVIKYLNRLSDFLFVLARFQGHISGVEEVTWEPRKS